MESDKALLSSQITGNWCHCMLTLFLLYREFLQKELIISASKMPRKTAEFFSKIKFSVYRGKAMVRKHEEKSPSKGH